MTYLSAPVLDVRTGVMTTVLPELSPPVFLRLAPPIDEVVDRARRLYLRAANSSLRLCVAGWRDGAGVLVARAPSDLAALSAELHELGRGIRVLGDSEVARSYLDAMTSRTVAGAGDAPAPNPEKET
jgi:hypothetical protein